MSSVTLTRRRVLTAAAVGMGITAGAGGSALGVQAVRGSARPNAAGLLRVDSETLAYFNELAHQFIDCDPIARQHRRHCRDCGICTCPSFPVVNLAELTVTRGRPTIV